MPRILTEESNKSFRREYRIRFLVTLLTGFALALVFLGISIAPAYVLLDSYENAYTVTPFGSDAENIEKLNQEYAVKLASVHELSQKVSASDAGHTRALAILFSYAGEGVSFDAVEISGAALPLSVTVRGTAGSRSALISLDNQMSADKRFSGFSLPIEALTKQSDIPFNVTFNYNEN